MCFNMHSGAGLATAALLLGLSATPVILPVHFRDVGTLAGLTTLPHTSGDKRYLIETMGGGVALFDCDNDGRLDIAVVNDTTIERFNAGGDPMITLYRQDGNLHFTDITQAAGLNVRGWGMGLGIADFDNDGLSDIYVTGYGHNVLYHNRGDCKFEDVTQEAGVQVGGFSVGAAWADYDRDGYVDLFVSRYVHSDIHNLPKPGTAAFDYKGVQVEIPETAGETHYLFRNRGDGTFEDVSQKAGVSNQEKRRGMGIVWCDYDGDGWPDLFVTNDVGANYLYHNGHDGTFEDLGMVTGTALSADGRSMGNMAADCGDFDRDGKLDIVLTRYGYQPVSLFHNDGAKGFTDVAWQANLSRSGYSPVRWGTGFQDFDNDGWPDIFIANGNVAPVLDTLPHEVRYREPLQFFRNQRDGSFEEIADITGLNDGPLQSRRGAAFGDVNNDGSVDVVVYNVGAPPSLFINESNNVNHRVMLRLVGTKSNKAAIGARVTLFTSRLQQIDEVRGGGSYLSSSDTRLHFGLGTESDIRKILIQWPSGRTEELKNVRADAIYTITEGKGITGTVKLPLPGRQLGTRTKMVGPASQR